MADKAREPIKVTLRVEIELKKDLQDFITDYVTFPQDLEQYLEDLLVKGKVVERVEIKEFRISSWIR